MATIITSLSDYFLSIYPKSITYDMLAEDIVKRTFINKNEIMTILKELYIPSDVVKICTQKS